MSIKLAARVRSRLEKEQLIPSQGYSENIFMGEKRFIQ
jgi:hypothetical protein